MESLLLLVSLPLEDTGHLLAKRTPLCHLLAQRLTELYCLIPSSLDSADIHSSSSVHWRCVSVMKCWIVYTLFVDMCLISLLPYYLLLIPSMICCWFCRTQFTQDSTAESQSFPGSESVHRFFCFLDFCDELIKEAPRVWKNYSFCIDHVCILSVHLH